MKKIFCISLAALIFFTGCAKPLCNSSQSATEDKAESSQLKESNTSMLTPISDFASDLCFDVEEAVVDTAVAVGWAAYFVGYVLTSDPSLQNNYYPYP